MIYNYPYLKDTAFLKFFDKLNIKEQFIKINVLTLDEKLIQAIEGKTISGSITIDGSSAMRRTANLTILADNQINNLTDIDNLLSLNKKVEILVGFTNNTGEYLDFPVLWFPQGVYAIIESSLSYGMDGVTISLTLHDKMAFLNGQCGGTFPASISFHEMDSVDEDGNDIILQPTIFQIIQQLVHHWGEEQLGKIIISDIDNRIKRVMKWTGDVPLYYYHQQQGLSINKHFSTVYDENANLVNTFYYGEDVGYTLTDFTYPGELIGDAGSNVAAVLEQIKNLLGNYEYFYDVHGNFHFQEIKNYLNKTYASTIIEDLNKNNSINYAVDYSSGKSVYTFDDADMIISYSNTPQYQQIKNDFLVWGKRTTVEGKQVPIRYHLAMDTKPPIGNKYRVFLYTDEDNNVSKTVSGESIWQALSPEEFQNFESFPAQGQVNHYYYAIDTGIIYTWKNNEGYQPTNYKIDTIVTTDFRTQLYLDGVVNEKYGTNSNYYYPQLKAEWPKMYDLKQGKFYDIVSAAPEELDFFLDFIDSSNNQFTISNIGRRTEVIVDDNINCIFEPQYPDIVVIETGTDQTALIRHQCQTKKQQYSQVSSSIYNLLLPGGNYRSAYQEIKKEIYQYTNYYEEISLNMIPIYYLEPNVRITIRNQQANINGDYIIKNISIPLDINGTMSMSCSKAIQRI